MRTKLLPLVLLLASCAGYHARQNALLPTMRGAWEELRGAAERESVASGHGGAAIAQADAAMRAGTEAAVAAVAWADIDVLIAGDTARREHSGSIGPGVAVSLREQHRQFIASRRKFLRLP
jgi:hypothetical protein